MRFHDYHEPKAAARKPLLKWWEIGLVLLLLTLVFCGNGQAQCTAGQVLWVSETVNANVGLGAGAGRCGSATVAGAACNSAGSPFGIQAAMDCACAGCEVRILAGANDYDSTTASWNNRFNASKAVTIEATGGTQTARVGIVGYADTATRCTALQGIDPDCPVRLNFATNTNDGLVSGFSAGFGNHVYIIGIRISNAQLDGIDFRSNPQFPFLAAVEVDGNGGDGIQMGSTQIAHFQDVYSHDNGGDGIDANTSAAWGLEIHDNSNTGWISQNTVLFRALAYSQAGSILLQPTSAPIVGATADSAAQGFDLNGRNTLGGLFGAIASNMTTAGFQDWRSPGATQNGLQAFSHYLAVGGNTANFANPAQAELADGVTAYGLDPASTLQEPLSLTYRDASTGDYAPVGVDNVSFDFPRGTSTTTFCPGASTECLSEGGLFVQPVRVTHR